MAEEMLKKNIGNRKINQANVTLDALCTLAEGYTNGKLVRSFAWKNRAKGVLDTGYNIAQQRFIALTVESQSRIGMEE
jgi:hypothetical protein